MQTTAIRTVAYSLPENEAILLTLLISNRYILFAELRNIFVMYNMQSRGKKRRYSYLRFPACLTQRITDKGKVIASPA